MSLSSSPAPAQTAASRRQCLAGAAALLAPWKLTQAADPKIRLRISSPAVPEDWHGRMWRVFKDYLDQQAPGVFDVRIHLNASLFKQGTEPVAMARGNLELSTLSAFDLAKRMPVFSLFTAGYVVRDPAHLQAIFRSSVGQELFQQVALQLDIVPLATAYLGTRQLNLREAREVHTPPDLKGIKLRVPASREWLFLGNALGATATPLAFGEIYLGLKTGTIDAQENPLSTLRAAKFYEVTQQIVLTRHLVDSLFITVSGRCWNALAEAQRALVSQAAQAAADYNNAQRLAEESRLLDFFRQQGLGVTDPDVAAFAKTVQLAYQNSAYAKVWPVGLRERIDAIH